MALPVTLSQFADLHLLTVLAQTRSYTQAARRLGISKASVSMRIAELERAAGLPLVRRTTRSVGLTDAGLRLVDDTQGAFAQIEQSFGRVRDQAGQPRGLVRVTAPVALGRQRIAPTLPDFIRRYPEIRIDLDLSDRLINLAQEGFDLAIRHVEAPPDTHVAWTLCPTRSLLVASPDYLRRHGAPQHPRTWFATTAWPTCATRRCRVGRSSPPSPRVATRHAGQQAVTARSSCPCAARCGPATARWCAKPCWAAWASACCPTSAPASTWLRANWCSFCATGRRVASLASRSSPSAPGRRRCRAPCAAWWTICARPWPVALGRPGKESQRNSGMSGLEPHMQNELGWKGNCRGSASGSVIRRTPLENSYTMPSGPSK